MRQFSIVTRINIALACIVTLAIGTMLASYWLSTTGRWRKYRRLKGQVTVGL
ncbi:hypothetical protein [Alishewanella longhuensis]